MPNSKTHHVIIGAGWLGLPLAKHFAEQGNQVTITNRQPNPDCSSNYSQFQFDLNAELSAETNVGLVQHLAQNRPDTLYGCFPPGFKKNEPNRYVEHWQNMVKLAKRVNAHKIVMVSTTGVYPTVDSNQTMNEPDASLVLAKKNSANFGDKAATILEAEQAVIDSAVSYIIARCSGLVGPERHPARFLKMIKAVSDQAPANMVHQRDVIAALEYSALHLTNTVVNVTTPISIAKSEFYKAANEHYHSQFEFPPIVDKPDKRISSKKLQDFGFQFHYNHVLEFFNDQNL